MENEDIKKDKEENKSWLGHIAEEIKEEAEHIDTDFPLSGGDESEPAVVHTDKKEEDKKTSFLHDLDTEFPLSGGETEED